MNGQRTLDDELRELELGLSLSCLACGAGVVTREDTSIVCTACGTTLEGLDPRQLDLDLGSPVPEPPGTLPTYIPSEPMVERAFEMEAVQKARLGEGLFKERAWHGFLGELVAAMWLGEEGVEVELNGGYDAKPDIVANGVGFGVKTARTKIEWRHNPTAMVPVDHLDKPWDYWLFLSVVPDQAYETTVLGAATPRVFAAFSKYDTSLAWKYPAQRMDSIAVYPPGHELSGQRILMHPGALVSVLNG